jgi:hypothetical protein
MSRRTAVSCLLRDGLSADAFCEWRSERQESHSQKISGNSDWSRLAPANSQSGAAWCNMEPTEK